ncbi:MAG: TonB-dependent receptor [Pseudomonadales bacterium]|nr:TonB-dependent receptor [Pseudomonadales bacterium]
MQQLLGAVGAGHRVPGPCISLAAILRRSMLSAKISGLGVFLISAPLAQAQPSADETMEQVVVWGTLNPFNTQQGEPHSSLTPADLVSINLTTTEDLVKYEPGVIIRQRFIGDANGTLGIRGANMFQTTRSMVFADGVPLHYFLQTRFNGSPRWSLVAADEIAEIDIAYGPFSAEYSGNSMGGVVNIETAIPTQAEFHADLSTFQQDYSGLGFDDQLPGYKGFMSYGNKIGNVSFYAAYNRLENDGHPQNFYRATNTSSADSTPINVTRGIQDTDEYGEAAIYFGNNGRTAVTADQFKLKFGFETQDWMSIVNIAYENRKSSNQGVDNYLVDQNGQPVWNGPVQQNGIQFDVESDDFAYSKSQRQSLLLGGRVRGQLNDNWHLELAASYFEILEDESYETNAHPLDPVYVDDFLLASEYGDTGWTTLDVKLLNDRIFAVDGLSLLLGYHHSRYELELVDKSGGKTAIHGLFSRLNYQINPEWSVSLGGRYEDWQSEDGFFISRGTFQNHPDRNETEFSPKFIVKHQQNNWQVAYSVAQAYRFPIVEELFQNERTARTQSVANASLAPEQGLHQNLAFSYDINNGYLSLNLFHEQVDDVIFSQTGNIGGTTLRTFLPVTRVTTQGVDFSVQKNNLLNANISLRFNLSYLDAEITRNDPNPLLEGNRFPRLPEWRANLIATWFVNQRWDVGGGIRFASNSFGDLDNADTANEVFGAHDRFIFVNLKSSYQLTEQLKLSVGIDNVTNEEAYVHHPWPGRTVFLSASIDR